MLGCYRLWRKKLLWIGIGLATACLAALPVLASQPAISQAGIDALRLQQPPYNLLGRKIAIGQVEIGRPGKFGTDKKITDSTKVPVNRVFQGDQPGKSNTGLEVHAQNVASIMIGNDKTVRGVAPAARLYATAVTGTRIDNRQSLECLASQRIAKENSGDMRAINFSFGEPLELDPRPEAILDGNALLTQCIDWSARVDNVVYVIAGNQGKGGIPIPTDNFNGINVAFSRMGTQVFDRVDVSNLGSSFTGYRDRLAGLEGNLGPRRSVALVAPGRNITMLNPDGSITRNTGTSFAAPQVTATVALLQEFGDRQLRSKQPQWSLDSRRQEVMKAVLLNSADKIQDTGDGLRLGMTRTLIDKDNLDWLASDSYHNPAIPLHSQMGTGHLNAFRAYQQFSAGQWKPDRPVAAKGWDYNTVSANMSRDGNVFSGKQQQAGANSASYREYILEQPLKGGSFVAITLIWNRLVELEDNNNNQQYDREEKFRDQGLNNLDLYLMSVTENDPTKSIRASISQTDSVEHIFYPIPQTGSYKIRVQYQQQINQPSQSYALAWWTVPQS